MLAGCAGGSSGTSTLPAQSGPRAPEQVVTTSTPSPTPSPSPTPLPGPPVGTLYMAVTDRVFAYDLAASGATTQQRTIIPHPNQTQILTGLATSADGTLDILENLFLTVNNVQSEYCRVVVESAMANGSPAAVGTHLCDPTHTGQGEGIGRNTAGGYDVLYSDTVLNKFIVRRFNSDGAGVSSTLQLDFGALYLATDRGGHDQLDTSGGRIVMYKAATTDPTVRAGDVTLAGNPQLGPIAVSPSPDRTVYVVQGAIGSQNIYALAPGSGTILRTIGPFTNRYISALAVDSHGNLYAGTNKNDNTFVSSVQVYAPDASGTPAPTRIIVPNPSINFFRGLAIFE